MNELIALILSTGTKVIISEETVLGGEMKRPLIVNYVDPSNGVVTETWEYAEDAQSRAWGAIKSVNYQLTSASDAGKLALRLAIKRGAAVIEMYLLDNRAIDLTTEQSLQQLQKFSAIKALFEVGAIDAAIELIQVTSVDSIFTQERKDKYLSTLTQD